MIDRQLGFTINNTPTVKVFSDDRKRLFILIGHSQLDELKKLLDDHSIVFAVYERAGSGFDYVSLSTDKSNDEIQAILDKVQ